MRELERMRFVKKNPNAAWAAAPLVIHKPNPKAQYRLTAEFRPVNAATERMAWTMSQMWRQVSS